MQALHNCAMLTGKYPEDLLRTYISPAYKGKPDDRRDRCADYRGIQYAGVVTKVLGNIILRCIQSPMADR